MVTMRKKERPLRALLLLLWVMSILLFFSCHRHRQVILSGTLHGAGRKMVYVELLNINVSTPLDSVRTDRRGSFRMRIPLEEPSFLLLKRSKNNFITLLARPGEKIHITADSLFLQAGYRVTGSQGSSLVKQLDDRLRVTVRQIDSLAALYRSSMDRPGFDTLRPRLEDAYRQLLEKQRKYNIAFILDHMHSLAAIKALYQKIDKNTYVLNDVKDLQ